MPDGPPASLARPAGPAVSAPGPRTSAAPAPPHPDPPATATTAPRPRRAPGTAPPSSARSPHCGQSPRRTLLLPFQAQHRCHLAPGQPLAWHRRPLDPRGRRLPRVIPRREPPGHRGRGAGSAGHGGAEPLATLRRNHWLLSPGSAGYFQSEYSACPAPCDYIPIRSYPLFLARDVLRTLREEVKRTRPATRKTRATTDRRPANHESEPA